MYGAVLTSDGEVHFVDSESEIVELLDTYGPEVVTVERWG